MSGSSNETGYSRKRKSQDETVSEVPGKRFNTAVIGKDGKAITQAQEDTHTKVKMSKKMELYPGTTERVCIISGSQEAVAAMHLYVMERILEKPDPDSVTATIDGRSNSERHKQVKILVPNSTAGMIIGKNGTYVNEIRQRTGAYIQLSQKPTEFNLIERCIIIAGELEQNKAAVDLVLNVIASDCQSSSCPMLTYSDGCSPVASILPTGSPFSIPCVASPLIKMNALHPASSGGPLHADASSSIGQAPGGVAPVGGLVNSGLVNCVLGSNPLLNAQLLTSISNSGSALQSLPVGIQHYISTPSSLLLPSAQHLHNSSSTPAIQQQQQQHGSNLIHSMAAPYIFQDLLRSPILKQGQTNSGGNCWVGSGTHMKANSSVNSSPSGCSGAPVMGLTAGLINSNASVEHLGHKDSELDSQSNQLVNQPLCHSTAAISAQGKVRLRPEDELLFGDDAVMKCGGLNARLADGSQIGAAGGACNFVLNQLMMSNNIDPSISNLEQAPALLCEQEIYVPESLVGIILGPLGKTIVELQASTCTAIKISKKGVYRSGTQDRIVTVTGTQLNVSRAVQLIEQSVNMEQMRRYAQQPTDSDKFVPSNKPHTNDSVSS